MESMICKICGGTLHEKGNGILVCECCDAEFQAMTFDKQMQMLSGALEQRQLDELKNYRQNLWTELNREYLSSSSILKWAGEIKKLVPDDFLAEFCTVLCGKDPRVTAAFLESINPTEHMEYMELILKVMLKSLKKAHLLAMNNLIERAYKSKDIKKYAEYQKALQREAEKVEDGVYRLTLPRDAFIAYSSKDMSAVSEIVAELEGNGLSCFVAMRNMQHGSGAVENYDQALQTAIRNCSVFVFVSSSNSRSTECDALAEVEYVRETSPDKPRVEYLLEEYNGKNRVAENIIKNFFMGCEYCFSADALALRVATLMLTKRREKEARSAESADKVKYCKACGIKLPITAKFCVECGNSEFVSDYEAAKKEDEEKAELQRAYKKIEEEKRRAELRTKSIEEERRKLEEEKLRLLDKYNELKAELDKRYKVAESAVDVPVEDKTVANPPEALSLADNDFDTELVDGVDTIDYDENEFEMDEDTLVEYIGDSEEVIIPDGVAIIGAGAFENCMGVVSVKVPESVVIIGESAFAYCGNLESINIPSGVYKIGEGVFSGCSNLNEINVAPDNANFYVKNHCLIEKNTNLLIRGTSESVIPDEVTAIAEYAFDFIDNLTHIEIPKGISRLSNYSFYSCSDLKSISLPKGLKYIGEGTFENCLNLSQIEIPDTVTEIADEAFKNCSALEKIILPKSVVTVGADAFCGCKKLTIYCEHTSKPDTWGNEWNNGCKVVWKKENTGGINGKVIAGKSKEIASKGIAGKVNGADIKDFDINNGVLVKYNGKNNVIDIPEGVVEIGLSAFELCSAIVEVNMPDTVQKISKLAFGDCNNLRKIKFSKKLTQIGEYAFKKCSKLKTLNFPDSLNEIKSNAFEQCTSLKEVQFPKTMSSIGSFAFFCCTSLKSIVLPNELKLIPMYCFYRCEKLEKVVICPDVFCIDSCAFAGCSSLKEINLPLILRIIKDNAFRNCSSLTSIHIPFSVNKIGEKVFEGCMNLTIRCVLHKAPSGWSKNWNVVKFGLFNKKAPVKYGERIGNL